MRSVLITGASSGIELATTKVLAGSGFRVFAGVRKFSGALGELAHVEQVKLDVTQRDSIRSARIQIERMLAELPPTAFRCYEGMLRTFLKRALASEKAGSPPEVVAQAVLDVLSSLNPPARRLVGKNARLMRFFGVHLPDFLRDAIFRRVFLGNPQFGSGGHHHKPKIRP